MCEDTAIGPHLLNTYGRSRLYLFWAYMMQERPQVLGLIGEVTLMSNRAGSQHSDGKM